MSRFKFHFRLACGPMSRESVKAVFRYSHEKGTPLALIASRNQIDTHGGYVSNWSTARFMGFVDAMRDAYPNAQVAICRDHCGPGFGATDGMTAFYETLENDIRLGFDLIHLDFTKLGPLTDPSVRERVMRAAYRARELNPNIGLEIGSEEPGGIHCSNLEAVEREAKLWREGGVPDFLVLQTGSLVREGRQVGRFDYSRCYEARQILHEHGILLKEHNADYLDSGLGQRRGSVDAMNIAPELGTIQTQVVQNLALEHGIDIEPWRSEVFLSRKWEKWLLSGSVPVYGTCALVAGHYHFTSSHYRKIAEQLSFHVDVEEAIIQALYSRIDHYANR